MIVHVREGDGDGKMAIPTQQPAINHSILRLSISISSSLKKGTMSSVQDNLIILTGSRKRGDISRVSGCGLHSMAPSLIIDGVCARVILNPERSGACSLRAAASQQQQQQQQGKRHRGAPSSLAGSLACTVRTQPAVLRTGHGPRPFEMMGHDWVAATRVHLVVQPGVPPLLFVSEGRWGPQVHLPQGWET